MSQTVHLLTASLTDKALKVDQNHQKHNIGKNIFIHAFLQLVLISLYE